MEAKGLFSKAKEAAIKAKDKDGHAKMEQLRKDYGAAPASPVGEKVQEKILKEVEAYIAEKE